MPRETVAGMQRAERAKLRKAALERMRQGWVVKPKTEMPPKTVGPDDAEESRLEDNATRLGGKGDS